MLKTLFLIMMLCTPMVTMAQHSVQYWFDQQTSRQTLGDGTSAIDCSALPSGIHFAHFQIKGADGMVSPVRSQAFLLIDENLNTTSTYSGANYWFDQQTVKTTYEGGDIDVSALANGIHAVHFQLIDNDGNACPAQSKYFVNLEFNAYKLYYWFDEDSTKNVMDIDGTEISVEALANGHHTLYAMLADAHGHVMTGETCEAPFTIVCPEDEHVDDNHDGVCDVCDEPTTVGIDSHNATQTDAVRYNLSGIRIPKGTKGIIIMNGKKLFVK